MKRILYSICIGTLALAVTAWGEDANNSHNGSRGEKAPAGVRASVARSTNHVSTAHVRSGAYSVNRGTVSRGVTYRNTVRTSGTTRTTALHARNLQSSSRSRVHNNVAVSHARNSNTVHRNNVGVNRNRTVATNRNVGVNNNWRGNRFAGRNYAAFRNYHRQWHDRGWWRGHYNRIVFVGGGWYFWNAGYWYPAWGYDSSSYYPYDGPIYGYNGMAPDQVTVGVQSQLQRDGYYAGPIDGQLGPMTRQAIANFQADHGLAITSAIDEPTLDS